MYDEVTVKNITTLALWSKDLAEENSLLQSKIVRYKNEIARLNEKIKEQSELIERIRANITEKLEDCI